jgi:DNA polymerase
MTHHLSIDIETYSDVDLGKCGLYKYTEGIDFQILLFGYSVDFGPVEVIDLTKTEGKLPENIASMLSDPDYIKHAYNAAFEITCLNKAGFETPAAQWRDTMMHGMYLGYPAGLARIGEALGLPQDKRKSATGKALIRYFSVPCKPTKRNGHRGRNLPMHDRDKWALYIEYNRQDVVTEMAIYKKLSAFPVPDEIQEQWLVDYQINSRGVLVDMGLVTGAMYIDETHREELMDWAKEITGLANPNSREQLLNWINSNSNANLPDLTKATVASAKTDNEEVKELLSIRKQLAKSSVSKYDAMYAAAGEDHRVRGLLQFYGARTGRWAGRLVQVQNLPRTYINLETARHFAKESNTEAIEILYGDVSDTLSQLIRTAFIAPENKLLCVADFSAIEARVLAWLAGEKWKMDIFGSTGKIYEATASRMFGVPMERIAKGNPEYELRQKGKIAELALGYQGGPNALIAMGALDKGIKESELPGIVKMWRNANTGICAFWNQVQTAAIDAINGNGLAVQLPLPFSPNNPMVFQKETAGGLDFLTIKLPCGRKLFYPEAHVGINQFNNAAVTFKSLIGNNWTDETTYGGKLVENITQAVARDCLAEALTRLENSYEFKPLMHIHDEVVMEIAKPCESREVLRLDQVMLRKAINIMCQPIPWAPGLKLNADGFVGEYYRKE